MSTKIVIPGDDPPQIQDSPHLDRLRKHGEVVLFTDRPATVDEQVHRARDATCLINSRGQLEWPGEILRQLPQLKMFTTCGIGTDSVNLETAKEMGIIVCNVPGKTAPVVAEHALALMFAVARRAWYQTNEMKQGRWTLQQNVYLHGKTLGIIGTGNIGAAMARLGKAVGMRVIAWTFHPAPEKAAKLGVEYVSLDELLKQADVVSVHVKLTDQSRNLIGEKQFRTMKSGALFINTARGAVVDTNALVEALNNGHLGGAGIDVFDEEPPPSDYPLLQCEQVVLTPHIADQTPEGIDFLNEGVADNVIAFLEGRVVNRVV